MRSSVMPASNGLVAEKYQQNYSLADIEVRTSRVTPGSADIWLKFVERKTGFSETYCFTVNSSGPFALPGGTPPSVLRTLNLRCDDRRFHQRRDDMSIGFTAELSHYPSGGRYATQVGIDAAVAASSAILTGVAGRCGPSLVRQNLRLGHHQRRRLCPTPHGTSCTNPTGFEPRPELCADDGGCTTCSMAEMSRTTRRRLSLKLSWLYRDYCRQSTSSSTHPRVVLIATLAV